MPRKSLLTSLIGIGSLVVLGIFAHLFADIIPHVSALVVAIIAGGVVSNAVDLPATVREGSKHHKLFLETGIVLLGVRLTIDELVNAGLELLVLTLLTVVTGLLLVEIVSRWVFGIGWKTGSLLAAGASICGVSAVLTVAGCIDADKEQIAYVAGTILLFDALTLIAFPLAGHLMDLPARTFGIWSGLSMLSTGPVTAAGFAYGPIAGKWATLTKIIRNSFIGLAAITYSVYFARQTTHEETDINLMAIWRQFPKFLVGFILVVIATNSGLVGQPTIETMNTASTWLFTVAFVGLGFDIRVEKLRGVGVQPIAVMVLYLFVMSLATLMMVTLLL